MTLTSETTRTLTVHPIDPSRLDAVRRSGTDGWGNAFSPFAATGEGEPLRCCLRFARAGESIALISFAPFTEPSVWREVGPVYVHAERCEGYGERWLPDELRRGPRVLRTYRADGSMNYEHNTWSATRTSSPSSTPSWTRRTSRPCTCGPCCRSATSTP
jgi:hypothetical protein